jgi:hypothetical protein
VNTKFAEDLQTAFTVFVLKIPALKDNNNAGKNGETNEGFNEEIWICLDRNNAPSSHVLRMMITADRHETTKAKLLCLLFFAVGGA